ncbi:MAG: ABC transporter permease [Planctomycetes bacterium]|nr:ABC transporter permease [Planctomycetota bacterium]
MVSPHHLTTSPPNRVKTMRARDLLRFALSALWQHKVRTLLTLSGVVAGSFLLVVSIAVGQGVEETTVQQFRKYGRLRSVSVFPGFQPLEKIIPPADLEVKGQMSDAKRERIRQGLIRHWPRKHLRQPPAAMLTNDRLKEIANFEHVVEVFPAIHESCRAAFSSSTSTSLARREHDVLVSAPEPGDDRFQARVVAGSPLPPSGKYVLVHEFLLYQWGLVTEEDVQAVVGTKLHLTYRTRGSLTGPALGLLGGGPASLSPMERDLLEGALLQLAGLVDSLPLSAAQKNILKRVLPGSQMGPHMVEKDVFAEDFTIAGVVREWMEKEDKSTSGMFDWLTRDTELFLPLATAQDLFGRSPRLAQAGYSRVTVTVDAEENVAEVTQRISALGYQCFSLAEVLEKVRKNVLLLGIVAAFLAAMALLVAAVGITNMMLMSVLERTHEIGVMKAVGARDGHIQLIFLAEGLVLGLSGGLVGLLAGWLASFPGDRIARSIVEKQTQTTLEHSLFVYPLWLVVGVPVFAVLVTTLAAVYPARRAARVNPIQALRHE